MAEAEGMAEFVYRLLHGTRPEPGFIGVPPQTP